MIHLKTLEVRPWPDSLAGQFPFRLTMMRNLQSLTFTSAVTFFVGENGSGKSTLLEAIACAAGSVAVGSDGVRTDQTLVHVREFAEYLRLGWSKKTHKGFFLRAEDFFGFARQTARTRRELHDGLKAVDDDYRGRSKLAVSLAKMPYARELHDLQHHYGEGLDSQSHGESFLKLFQARFVPNGFYLLDEPEAPLSPSRQLAFLFALKQMVDQQSQFIIATHSPIVLAFPEATILNFAGDSITTTRYDDLEHVSFTRAFLNNRESFLRHL